MIIFVLEMLDKCM